VEISANFLDPRLRNAPVNEGFAFRADAPKIADGLGNWHVIRHRTGGTPGFTAFHAIHLAGLAGSFGVLAPLFVKFPKVASVKQGRLAAVHRWKTLLDPLSDGVFGTLRSRAASSTV